MTCFENGLPVCQLGVRVENDCTEICLNIKNKLNEQLAICFWEFYDLMACNISIYVHNCTQHMNIRKNSCFVVCWIIAFPAFTACTETTNGREIMPFLLSSAHDWSPWHSLASWGPMERWPFIWQGQVEEQVMDSRIDRAPPLSCCWVLSVEVLKKACEHSVNFNWPTWR